MPTGHRLTILRNQLMLAVRRCTIWSPTDSAAGAGSAATADHQSIRGLAECYGSCLPTVLCYAAPELQLRPATRLDAGLRQALLLLHTHQIMSLDHANLAAEYAHKL